MKIFDREKSDGLESILKAKSSISLASAISATDDRLANHPRLLDSIELAKAKVGDADLYPVTTILVSTNWNDNEDVFIKDEVWASRHTPEDKPSNLEHVEADIIGHIIANDCYTDNLELIDDNTPVDKVPNIFNIVTASVIYKQWDDQTRKEQIVQMIEEIEAGKANPAKAKWFVSMECLFNSFDYAIIEPDGKQHIVERNKSTAFLTKHLKAYGGNGVYNGKRVGRVLKNMIFSGKGFTTNPANKKSVILKAGASKQIFVPNYSGSMIMDNDKVIEELKAAVAKLNAEKDALSKQISENKEKAVSEKITALEGDLAVAKKNADEAAKKLAEVVKTNEELVTANTKYAKELSDLAHASKVQNRVSKLVEAGLSKEDATAKATKFDSLNDEMFDEIVSMSAATVKAEAAAKAVANTDDDKAVEEKKKAEAAAKAKAEAEDEESDEDVEVEDVDESADASLDDDVKMDEKILNAMSEYLK